MVDVFISYSRSDQSAVERLARAVQAEGYEVWWDADLPPHLSYGDVISAKIGMAKAAIVVWSHASAASEWVRAEADMARNQKKLVQTALDDVMPPLPFNQIQFANIGDWGGEPDHPGWRKVKASLAELIGGAAPADGPPRPIPAPVPARPAAAAAKSSRWPLYAGIAAAAVALAVTGWNLVHEEYVAGEIAGEEREVRALEDEPDAVPAGDAAPATVRREPAAELVREEPLPPARPAVAPAAETPRPAQPAPASADFASGAIIPDSSTRRLTPADIAGLGPLRVRLARNEIFARHGRRFRDPDLVDYFGRQPWYRPVADEVDLSEIELANVALLRRAEVRVSAGAMR